MKNILVPTDFSTTAERAFRYALMLAEQGNFSITLYHVYTPVKSSFIEVNSTGKDEYNRQMEESLQVKLDRLKKNIAGNSAVEIKTVIGYAPVIDNILGYAEHNNIHLIVMGTQGATGIKKIVVGTIANKIINETEIPTILIPDEYELKTPEIILFTSHILNYNLHHLKPVIALAELFKASLKIVHFYSEDIGGANYEEVKKEFDDYKNNLLCEKEYSKAECRLIRTTDISKEFENLHNVIPYDLIVMVRRKKAVLDKFLFKSFTREMAYTTKYPLLILQENVD